MKDQEKAKANEIKVTMTASPARISKVEMKAKGTEGLVVTYATTEVRNGIGSPATDVATRNRPVQKELRILFDQLKEHMLRCLGYYWPNEEVFEMLKNNILVSYVLTNEDNRFMIGGKVTVKECTGALNTPLFNPDNYDEIDELKDLIAKIKNEAKQFLAGKGPETRDVVAEYLKEKKGSADAEAEYDNMSEEERDAAMKEAFDFYHLEIIEEDGKQVIAVKDSVEVTAEQVASGEPVKIVANAKAEEKKEKAPVKKKAPEKPDPVVVPDDDMPPLFDESDDDSPVF